MKTVDTKQRICPKCGSPYRGSPAVSRVDCSTLICPDCGIREALESIGVGADEQAAILEIIHHCKQQ